MPTKPNLLVIMSDQHNPKVMGCAGDPVVRTPNLDALAERGTRFTNAYCPAPLCVPSRMSFMTSRYPGDQRVWSNRCYLAGNIPTFAHGLSIAGYETVLCGRMHFEGFDQRHGFEKAIVGDFTVQHPGTQGTFLISSPGQLGKDLGNATGQSRRAVEIAGPGRTSIQAYDEAVARGARAYLKGRKDERPFCLVVGFYGPHCPFVCPKDLYHEYYDKVKVPKMPEGYFEQVHPFVRQWRSNRGVEDITEEEARKARAGYYGMVTFTDQRVGEIMEGLDESGLGDDTLVIYTSDHGDMIGDHGLWWKSNFYEGSAGIPMIAVGPGRAAEGRTTDRIVNLTDIGTTLLELGEAEPAPFTRGRSLLGLLDPDGEGVMDGPDETFCENGTGRGDRVSRMIRSGPWKLNHYHGYDTPQLFNIEDDPGELRDLAGDPAHCAVRDELLQKVLRNWDGDAIEKELERGVQDYGVISRWGRTVRPSTPDHWKPPKGVDVFPDE